MNCPGSERCNFFDDDLANAQGLVEVYDPWTILPLMAETTERIRIGSLVSPAGRRHPALFAKMTSIVDIISNGRLIVGMGHDSKTARIHIRCATGIYRAN